MLDTLVRSAAPIAEAACHRADGSTPATSIRPVADPLDGEAVDVAGTSAGAPARLPLCFRSVRYEPRNRKQDMQINLRITEANVRSMAAHRPHSYVSL